MWYLMDDFINIHIFYLSSIIHHPHYRTYKYDPYDDTTIYPDLSQLDHEDLEELASVTAQLFCADPKLAGLQIDLEPFVNPYAAFVDGG